MAERDGEDDWIAERLKAEANRYEPDLERIRQRIRERGLDDPVRRSAWLVPAAAATFVVLTAGVITAVHSGQSSGPPGRVQVVGPARTATAVLPSAPGASGTPAPPSSRAPGPIGTATSSGPKPSGSPASRTTDDGGPQADAGLTLVAAKPGQPVSLPGGAVDWIAAGRDSAGETIRRQHGSQLISGPHETGTATSTTTNGPFAMSWTGGMPEQSHSGSRRWRTVTGPAGGPETGLLLRVPAGQGPAELVLYVGADGADGQLRTRLGAQGRTSRTQLKAVGGGGYVVTIRIDPTGPSDELTVELISGSGGSVSFAAAALR